MEVGITTAKLSAFIGRAAQVLTESRDELNALDARLGDGDIGVTIGASVSAIAAEIETLPEDVGMALMKCAQIITRTGGSSFCTLLAAGLMSAAKTAKGLTMVPLRDTPELLQAAIERMSGIGKSALGDKTVIDAIEAIRRAVEVADKSDNLRSAIVSGLDDALDTFRPRPCRQGRARIFAKKSVGLNDPGMMVIRRIVDAL